MPKFYEFFAGGGMARAGLGTHWECLLANDFDEKKGITYRANWGSNGELRIADVRAISASKIDGTADLVWGSFPCQDLSQAGSKAGLMGKRSGTFYPFWEVINNLVNDNRAPKIIALENVCGALTSHGGKDFQTICETFADSGYRFGALIIDAELFVPQSRSRLFIIGVHKSVAIDPSLTSPAPLEPFHTRVLKDAVQNVPCKIRREWLWWNIPTPPHRQITFADIIEDNPSSVRWHTAQETQRILDLMSPLNLAKVESARRAERRMVGTIYRRMRPENGVKTQRAEVRFDDISGCIRTPAGGSSVQVIIVVEGNFIRSRPISSRETARLMGLPDTYELPKNYYDSYHLIGDGVAVPVVRHLAHHLFEPILNVNSAAICTPTTSRIKDIFERRLRHFSMAS